MDTRACEYRLVGYQTQSILRLWDPQTDKGTYKGTSNVIVPNAQAPRVLPDNEQDLDSEAEWLRPAKAFATLAINPFVNAWPKTYKEAMKQKEAAY
ncbi:hypothetical protein VTO42DRAFT_4438 [Malbranchea cinnamomea]